MQVKSSTPDLIIPAVEKRLNNLLHAFNRASAVNSFISTQVKQDIQEDDKKKKNCQ